MMLRSQLSSIILALCLSTTACAGVTSSAPAEYRHWLGDLKTEMHQKGISQKTLDTVYAQDFYHPEPEVVKFDRRQTEFVLTTTDYLNRVVTKQRIDAGRKHYQQLKPLLKQVQKQYGVSGQYLIAFWGVETNFGSTFGGYNTIAALTMLSYDTRRPQFFKKELYEALKIIDTNHIDYTQMQGSWAGAMGHFQFMPSTFNAYAVDFNGDGQIDIWRSFEDASASAANYLSTIGWKADEPWGMEVSLPWNFDFSQTGRNKNRTVKEWQRLGIKATHTKQMKLATNLEGAIIMPEGKKGPAYLVFGNFHKIMQWNHSENYALAVGLLSDYIATGQTWQPVSSNAASRLKIEDVIEIQSFINKHGWAKLDEDGQLGSQTKEAVMKVQKAAKLPADGYPDYQLLQKIRRYTPEVGFVAPVPARKLHKGN